MNNGAPKMIYVINIEKLVKHATETGPSTAASTAVARIGQGHGDEATARRWPDHHRRRKHLRWPALGALDNFNYTPSGAPTE